MPNHILIVTGPGCPIVGDIDAVAESLSGEIAISVQNAVSLTDVSDLIRDVRPDCSGVIYSPTKSSRPEIDEAIANFLRSKKPLIEVHSGNIFSTDNKGVEPLRLCGSKVGLISGLGCSGIRWAVEAISGKVHDNIVSAAGTIWILNGPNLNLLGTREPEIYGSNTLADVQRRSEKAAQDLGITIDFRQSNHEGDLVDWIQESIGKANGLIINAGAYTHTSIAIHDALRAFPGKILELHISNPHVREAFRHQSFVAPAADFVMTGLGVSGYGLALKAMASSPVINQ